MAKETGGRFVWYDLMTTDPEGARAFYRTITGWGLEDWQQPEGKEPYTMWTVDGVPVGGVGNLPDEARKTGAPPHWLGYVGVPDTDATTTRAQELGATILVEPTDIPEVGRFSVLADPQGAVVAVFTPTGYAPGGRDEPGPGDFSWHELATSDHEGAWAFYHDLFGWERTHGFDMGDGWMYEMFSAGGTQGGMFTKGDDMPGPPGWLYYVTVADMEEAVRAVEEAGGKVLHGPMEVPGGDRVAQCLDPQGAAFALHEKGPGA